MRLEKNESTGASLLHWVVSRVLSILAATAPFFVLHAGGTVVELAHPMLVTSAVDETDAFGRVSLREAVAYAAAHPGALGPGGVANEIRFAPSLFETGDVQISLASELAVGGSFPTDRPLVWRVIGADGAVERTGDDWGAFADLFVAAVESGDNATIIYP